MVDLRERGGQAPASRWPQPERATPRTVRRPRDELIGAGSRSGQRRVRRKRRLALVAGLGTVVVLAGWLAGAVYGAMLGALGLSGALVVALLGAAHRWRPLGAHSRLLGRLPLALVLLGLALGAAAALRAGWPLAGAALAARSAPLGLPVLSQGSTVYDAEGHVAAVFRGDVNRQTVSLSAVAPVMVSAVVDTEDARFWSHGGVDLYGLVRAGVHDLTGSPGLQGASTLSMQLVKNTLLAGQPDDLAKKVQEAILADRLESRIGRRGVLQDYLNTVYFGEGAYGAQAAAEEYFGIPAGRLDAAQSALLAGLIQDPVGYDPLRNPSGARSRRAEVLHLMVAHHDLSAAAARRAEAEPLPVSVRRPPSGDNYFMAAVRQELLSDPALGATPQARYQALYYGGLQIDTTLDPTLQAEATRAVERGLPPHSPPLSAALVAIDPGNGAVRAVVGGPGFSSSQFDAALASPGRPTGSAFKVFTLVAALEQGYRPDSLIDGSGPCAIPDPGNTPDPWVVHNYEGESFGSISITTATQDSVNCAYARLAMQVGLARIAAVAHSMGVAVPLAVVPSMTLGTNSIPPVQMASAYATLADDGVYHRPYLVSLVRDRRGQVLLRRQSPAQRVMSRTIARTTTQVLRTVVTAGTGTAAAVPGQDVAGKTGTGERWSDAWFVGYSRYLSAAVWMGSPAGEVPMLDVGNIPVAGGTYPARIWHAFMAAALAGRPDLAFPAPQGPLPPGPGTGGGAYPADGSPASPTTTTTAPASPTTTTSPTTAPASPTTTTSPTTAPTTTTTAPASPTTTTTAPASPTPSSPPTTASSGGASGQSSSLAGSASG